MRILITGGAGFIGSRVVEYYSRKGYEVIAFDNSARGRNSKERSRNRTKDKFSDWRPADQKVYTSNIEKLKEKLKWEPRVSPEEGIKN